MPELPEVETTCRGLRQKIVNHTINNVIVYQPKLRWEIDKENFIKLLTGNKICEISRRAKYILVSLERNQTFIIHLGMSGRLGVFSKNTILEKHTHVLFQLDNDLQLRFRDPRRFGFLELCPTDMINNHPRLKNLGVEPLTTDFNVKYFNSKIKSFSRSIKQVLLDSQIVVGIGNIYANEALFDAGINPATAAKDLDEKRLALLIESVKVVLTNAIIKGGTTLTDFRNVDGEVGIFQLDLNVYGRAGEKCIRCSQPITRIKQGGRSTFYCNHCQV